MYSLLMQKKTEKLLYLLIAIVLLQMPFRYMNLFMYDTIAGTVGKYAVIIVSSLFLFVMIMAYVTSPTLDRKFDIHHFRDIAIMVFCMSIMGVVVGFYNGGRFYYVVGDAFRHISPWLFFFLFLWVFQILLSSGRMDVVERVLGLMAIVGVVESVATYVMRYYDPTLRMSTNLYMWTILWCLYQKKISFLVILPVLLLAVSAPLISGKRSPVIMLAIVAVVFCIYFIREILSLGSRQSINNKYILRQALTIVFVLMIIFMMLPVITDGIIFSENSFWLSSAIDTVSNVFEIVTKKTQDPSYEGRWVEWDNIVEYMKSRPELWIWGAGFGAEFMPSDSRVVLTVDGTMHNVHQAWGAYFLRSGLLGLFLFFWFFVKLIWYFIISPKQYPNWQYLCVTIMIFCVVGSFSSNVMQESFGEGFFAAMLYCLSQKKAEYFDFNGMGNIRL